MSPMALCRKLVGLCLALFSAVAHPTAQAQVGIDRVELAGLPVTLVYPSAAISTRHRIGPFEIEGAPGAEPLPGRRRLVVLSHGTGGSALADYTLAATLARAGFLVAQPQHAGDNYQDASLAGPASWMKRPYEISAVIDALGAHPRWQARLALDRVGVHGMSAGGLTALTLAGGQWRTLDLVSHCLANGEEDFGFCYAGAPGKPEQDMRRANYERAKGVPEQQLPDALRILQGGRDSGDPRPDPRVAAVTVSVPVAAILRPDSLERIAVPVGVVTAGRDVMLLPRFHGEYLLANCPSCIRLAELPDAGHFDVLSPWPQVVAAAVVARNPRSVAAGSDASDAQRQVAHDRITAFFRNELKQ